jgi:hypothetical protein
LTDSPLLTDVSLNFSSNSAGAVYTKEKMSTCIKNNNDNKSCQERIVSLFHYKKKEEESTIVSLTEYLQGKQL